MAKKKDEMKKGAISDEKILAYALENAITHDGKALPNSVLGKLFLEGLKKESIKDVMPKIQAAVKKVNGMKLDAQKKEFDSLKDMVKERVHEQREGLPELQNAKEGKVVMRMAPNPNGPMHIGHARMIILNDEYVKRYKGKLILRFDDTDPKNENKRPMKEAYGWFEDDLKWLGVKYGRVERASARLDRYYKFFEELLDKGLAYVCTCEQEAWSEQVRRKRKMCPCRELGKEDNLERWKRMLSGKYREGQAVGRMKTPKGLEDPALIDWPTFRIIEQPHPLEKKKKVWPMLDFASAYDDYDMGITHILRGKDLVASEHKQRIIYDYMKWKYPEVTVYGKFVTTDEMIISKRKIAAGIKEGRFTGYDDVRLALIRAYRKKGILAQAIRNYMVSLGVALHETTVDLDILYNENRKLIDEISNRYFAVLNPVEISLKGLDKKETTAPLYPDKPERGMRTLRIIKDKAMVSSDDLKLLKKGEKFRLLQLANFTFAGKTADFVEETGQVEKKLHWVSEGVKIELVMGDASIKKGLVEMDLLKEKAGNHVQFERVGYCVLDKVSKALVKAYFTHR